MSCRHQDGDPTCGTKNPTRMAMKARIMATEADALAKRWIGPEANVIFSIENELTPTLPESQSLGLALPASPNPNEFEVLRYACIDEKYFIIEAQYPSCASCSYEGRKLMVFKVDGPAVFWSRIDPHFRDPAKTVGRNEAPSPIARFPATEDGWIMARALCYTLIDRSQQ